MKKLPLLVLALVALNCKSPNEKRSNEQAQNTFEAPQSTSKIIPISHGTLVIEYESEVIYVDPTGGAAAFNGQSKPSIVLITDIHGDHLSTKTLNELDLGNTPIIVPQAVAEKIPSTLPSVLRVMNNGDKTSINGIEIEAIPMYNLREEALKFHEKGRGNGYVLNLGEERIYISGDTEDIPEMRQLKNIDKALVCMNLPYTMTIESAASAVLDFKPKQVIPYHYRGTNGFSDVNSFKSLVESENSSIEVLLLNWY